MTSAKLQELCTKMRANMEANKAVMDLQFQQFNQFQLSMASA